MNPMGLVRIMRDDYIKNGKRRVYNAEGRGGAVKAERPIASERYDRDWAKATSKEDQPTYWPFFLLSVRNLLLVAPRLGLLFPISTPDNIQQNSRAIPDPSHY